MYLLTQMNPPKKHHMTQNKIPLLSLDKQLERACTCSTAPKCHILKLGPSKFYPNVTLLLSCSQLPGTANTRFDEVKDTWIYLPSERKQFKWKLHYVSNASSFLPTLTN